MDYARIYFPTCGSAPPPPVTLQHALRRGVPPSGGCDPTPIFVPSADAACRSGDSAQVPSPPIHLGKQQREGPGAGPVEMLRCHLPFPVPYRQSH